MEPGIITVIVIGIVVFVSVLFYCLYKIAKFGGRLGN